MKRAIFIILVTASAMFFFSCSENNTTAPQLGHNDQAVNSLAKKPAPNLSGPVKLIFRLPPPPPAPQIFWDGTVNFGTGELGIRFISLSKIDVGQTSHFKENFYIYDLITDEIYLAGSDAGSLSLANMYGGSLNGVVEEVSDSYKEWLGRRFHFRGEVVFLPDGGMGVDGTLRIN